MMADGKLISAGPDEITSTDGIAYEVIRIIDGKPLFLHDHILRMSNSLNKPELANWYMQILQIKIIELIDAIALSNGNLRIDASHVNNFHYQIQQIPHHYPGDGEYVHGVRVALLHAERSRPGQKIWNQQLRNQANEMISAQGVREVLLVNRNNEITEGSRSNVFFISGNNVVSAPLSQVLEGITRKHVIRAIEKSSTGRFAESKIPIDKLNQYEAAFLTGTSLKILPICKVGDSGFNPQNSLLAELMVIFEDILTNNLNATRP